MPNSHEKMFIFIVSVLWWLLKRQKTKVRLLMKMKKKLILEILNWQSVKRYSRNNQEKISAYRMEKKKQKLILFTFRSSFIYTPFSIWLQQQCRLSYICFGYKPRTKLKSTISQKKNKAKYKENERFTKAEQHLL